jgi:acetylornithine aminotransferase
VIQGEGGIRPVPAEYLGQVRQLCTDKGITLVLDEVQTGMGRTGRMWAHQSMDETPDVMTVAKGLANGLPIGAMICSEELSKGFAPGSHATTFGGGPLVAATGATVMDIIDRDGLCPRAGAVGQEFLEVLQEVASSHPEKIREIRGKGLMLGVELAHSGAKVWNALLDRGFICNLTQDCILRLLPPLTVGEKDLRDFAVALEHILQTI